MEKNYLCLQCGVQLVRQSDDAMDGVRDCDLHCPVCGGGNVVSHSPDAFFRTLIHGSGGG